MLRTSVNRTWGYIQDTTEFWTHYIKSQTVETANGIWADTKPNTPNTQNIKICIQLTVQVKFI